MINRRHCPDFVTELEDNQIFVFGSNAEGFHGAGSAGQACRGEAKSNWRKDKWFLKAIDSPEDSEDRVGVWAIYGVARGLQEGRKGLSYAIQTIETPGKQRSTSLQEILVQFKELGQFARENPEAEFLMTIGGGGYSGYSVEEISGIYSQWHSEDCPPDNILCKTEYEFRSDPKLMKGIVISTMQMAQWKRLDRTVIEEKGYLRLDITKKSGDPVFSPSWNIILAYKDGKITWEEYTQRYQELMRRSYKENRSRWDSILSSVGEENILFLLCYCDIKDNCHRHLLAGYLEKVGKKNELNVIVLPEMDPTA